jgi:hypothetical protein
MSKGTRVTDPGAWQPAGGLHLPLTVTTAARLAVAGADLHLWINGPNSGTTTWLRLDAQQHLTSLPLLDFTCAGVAICGDDLLLTGADAAGEPLVTALTPAGETRWRHALQGPAPTIWPTPYCAGDPLIAWQTGAEVLHTARVSGAGIGKQRTVPVGFPPLHLAADGQTLRAVWADPDGVRGLEIAGNRPQPLHIPMRYPDGLALGGGEQGWQLAWQQGMVVHHARWSTANGLGAAIGVELGAAAGGRLALVGGHRPLVWAQRAVYGVDERVTWASALALPHLQPLLLDGLVHAVGWWGERLVVVGANRLLFFHA